MLSANWCGESRVGSFTTQLLDRLPCIAVPSFQRFSLPYAEVQLIHERAPIALRGSPRYSLRSSAYFGAKDSI